jgi:hypothetical protein
MPATLHQQKGRDYRKFRIQPEALLVEAKSIGRYDAYRLDWEEVDFDAVVRGRGFDIRQTFLLATIFLNVLFAFWIVWLLWVGIRGTWWFYVPATLALLAFVYPAYLLTVKERVKMLYGDANVTFWYRPEDEESVDAFIKSMEVARNRYLRDRFLQIDDLLPLDDQIRMVQGLYINKMISREDLAQVMEEVKTRRLFED